ncbi:MAG: translocation/assembly module TamB domain-containing protein [Vicinamibacterales bacterium]|nr:translocation/assembly module TamB domain-containing protein [Vicinamibacterales bacterium]
MRQFLRRSFVRRLFWAGVAAAVLVGGLHLPVVRGLVLDRVAEQLEERYGLSVEATQFEYNLFTQSFEAENLQIGFSNSPPIISVESAEVQLNWPVRPGIVRLDLEDVDLAWSDPSQDFAIEASGLGLRLDPSDGNASAGPLGMAGSASIEVGDRTILIDDLDARLAFDGEDLGIEAAVVETPWGRVELSGAVRSLLATPEMVLIHRGSVDLEALAAFWRVEVEAAGTVAVEGRLDGSLESPEASLVISGGPLRAGGLDDIVIARSEVTASGGELALSSLDLEVAGGRIRGTGRLGLDESASGTVALAWTDLDLEAILDGLAVVPPIALDGVATGAALLDWPTLSTAAVTGTIENDIRPAVAQAPEAVSADWRVELGDSRWSADLRQRVGDALRTEANLGGVVSPDALADTTISGRIQIDANAVGAAALGLLAGEPRLAGELRAALDVGGTLGAPRATGDIEGHGLVYEAFGPATLRGTLAGDPDRFALDSLEVALGANTLRLDGQLDLQTSAIDGTLAMDLGDLAALAGTTPADWRVTGAATLDGQLGGRWPEPEVDATLGGADIGAGGLVVDRLDAELRLDPSGLTIDRLAARQADGTLALTGRYDFTTGGYTLTSSAEALRVRSAGSPTRPDLTLGWTLDGAGTTADPRAQGRLSLADLRWLGRTVGRADVDLDLAGDTLAVATTSPELGLILEATVDRTSGEYQLTADIDGLDPGRLLAAPETAGASPLSGALSGTAQVAGVWSDPTASAVTLDLRELDARLRGAPFRLEAPARVRYSADGVEVDGVEVAVGSTLMEIEGRISAAPTDRLVATLRGDLGDAVSLVALATGVSATGAALTGPLQARATIAGPLDAPSIEADLELDGAAYAPAELPPVTGLDARVSYRDWTVTLDGVAAEWQGARLTGSGALPVTLLQDYLPEAIASSRTDRAPARVDLRIEAVTPAALAPFLEPSIVERLTGRVDASLAVEADAWAWPSARGELTLERAELAAADVPVAQRVPTRLRLADGRIEVDTWEWGSADNIVSLSGGVGIADELELDLAATGRVDVGMVSALLRGAAASGEASLDMRLSGSSSSPEVRGTVQLSDVSLRIADPQLTITSLNGHLLLDADGLRTDGITGLANGGELAVDGELALAGVRPTGGSLSIVGRGLAMNIPEGLRSEVDADLTLELSDDRPALGGVVTVLRGGFRQPLSLTSGLLAALSAPRLTALIDEEPSALDELTLNARLTTAEDIVVTNNYADLELGADIALIGTIGQPALTGRVQIREGGEIFLAGTTYEIESGAIDFTNPVRVEPILTVTARTRVSDYDITLNLNGTPTDLRSGLSASPAASKADIISLLLTGRTLDEAGAATGAIARERALGLVSGEAFGAAGRAVGLDTLRLDVDGGRDVRFDSSLIATETDPGTRLTFGRNLSRDIQLIFSQSLSESGALTWIVNYTPRRNIELRAVVFDNNDRSYEFRHAVTFGAAAPAAGAARPPAPSAPPTLRVTAVEFSGTPRFDDAALLDQLDVTAGRPFEFYLWQRDQDTLERFYHDRAYREVRIRESRVVGDGTLRLLYEIDAGPMTTLAVEGYSLPGRLRRELEEAWNQSVFDGFLLDELRTIVRGHLAVQGYVRARVDAIVRVDTGDAKTIAVTIAPGIRSHTRQFVFTGQAGIDADTLERELAAADLTVSAWLDAEPVANALTVLYRRSGWLNAQVRVGPAEFSGATATLPVRIVEGARFTISSVTLEGLDARAETEAHNVLGLAPGDLYLTAEVQAARLRLDADYRAAGFNTVQVDLTASVDRASGEAAVRIAVSEGPRQLLDSIAVTGIYRTHPGVIDRALQLTPGEAVNLESWFEARRRLYDSGVFRSVNIEAEPADDTSLPGTNDIEAIRARVTVEEWPAYRLRYGVQLADENAPLDEVSSRSVRPGLTADLTRSNLLGRAATVGISTRYTRVERAVRGFVSTPSMFGLPLTTSLFASLGRESLSDDDDPLQVTADLSEATIEQRFRPVSNLTVAYAYDFERNHTFNEIVPIDDFGFAPIPFDLTEDIARLSTTGVWDTRDDLIAPKRGWFHSSSLEYATETLGSDVRFVKYLAQQSIFRSVGRGVVLASAFRLGLAKGFELAGFEQQLIPTERFVAGGGNSVRGYRENSLGPIDFLGDVGGQALLIFNQEVRFPVAGRFGGVAFFDAGNSFERVHDLSISDLRMGVGFGLRVDTPFALLRADYGARLRREASEPFGRWFFSIGHAF